MNYKVGQKVNLKWIKGKGHAKIVGIYEDWLTIIHPCYNKPWVVDKDKVESIQEG